MQEIKKVSQRSLNNFACAAQNTKINAIFVHVKAAYDSHKPTF